MLGMPGRQMADPGSNPGKEIRLFRGEVFQIVLKVYHM
jgi:hypothetical protein